MPKIVDSRAKPWCRPLRRRRCSWPRARAASLPLAYADGAVACDMHVARHRPQAYRRSWENSGRPGTVLPVARVLFFFVSRGVFLREIQRAVAPFAVALTRLAHAQVLVPSRLILGAIRKRLFACASIPWWFQMPSIVRGQGSDESGAWEFPHLSHRRTQIEAAAALVRAKARARRGMRRSSAWAAIQ